MTKPLCDIDNNRVVVPYKIQKALNLGNLDGVKRLAKFVGTRSVNPDVVYRACEVQREGVYLGGSR